MDIVKEQNKITWKHMFKTCEAPIAENSVYMYSPADKCIIVVTPGPQSGFKAECYTVKGFQSDSREYSHFFQNLFIGENGHVCCKFYSYAEAAWQKGRFLASAGMTNIQRSDD